jgi:hypothetical protein
MNGLERVSFAISLLVVGVTIAGCNDRASEAYIDGQGQAERDIASGTLKIAYAEGSMPMYPDYQELLQGRYHIGSVTYSAPGSPIAAAAWAKGYNEVASTKVRCAIGDQVLKQTMAEAQKLQEARKPSK